MSLMSLLVERERGKLREKVVRGFITGRERELTMRERGLSVG